MYGKIKNALTLGIVFLLVALSAVASYSGETGSSLKIKSVAVPGASAETNNIAFVSERYAILAPFAPSENLDADSDLSAFDNHFIYLVDTQKSDLKIKSADLQFCYYPTRVLYDPENSAVFVRGTEFIESGTGELQPREVIARLHLNLEGEKPSFDTSVAKIPIEGVNGGQASEAPMDFALGYGGKLLVFTNGASVITYRAIGDGPFLGGEIYRNDLIAPSHYGADFSVSLLDIDEASNTIIVTVHGKEQIEGKARPFSEIYFYKLVENGTLNLMKWVSRDKFPEGVTLVAGSNATIVSEPAADGSSDVTAAYAFFVTNDGALFQVDLRDKGEFDGNLIGKPERVDIFPELAQIDPDIASPRIIKFDPATRILAIVKRGYTLLIRRPIHGRPDRPGIRRPIHAYVEAPSLALAQLNKKNKIVKRKVFLSEFDQEQGLSNLIFGADSRAVVASYSGKLFSLSIADNWDTAKLETKAELGARVSHIVSGSTPSSVIALSSFESEDSDDDTMSITSPGALFVASPAKTKADSAGGIVQMLLPPSSLLRGVIPSIRRPCNLTR